MRKILKLKSIVLAILLLGLLLSVPMAMAQEEGTEDLAAEEAAVTEIVEEVTNPLDTLGINGGFFLAQVINFLLIFALLTVILWKPAINMLDSRSATIQKGLEDAAEAARARQNAEADVEKVLADARAESARIMDEARTRGDELARSIESQARSEADQILQDARAEAEGARDAELASLRGQVLNISSAVAGRILGENIDAKKQQSLVDRFFSEIPAEAKGLSGDVEVISAMPLTDAEKKRASETIGGDLTFRVDPSILGGLVVVSGEKVIDGSARSSLTNLTGRLN